MAVEMGWTAKIESGFGCRCCFKIDMRLMLESRVSTLQFLLNVLGCLISR